MRRYASNWSAYRMMQELPEFDLDKTLADSMTPVYFTGEMVSLIVPRNEFAKAHV